MNPKEVSSARRAGRREVRVLDREGHENYNLLINKRYSLPLAKAILIAMFLIFFS
jgi:hypothetical protein